jgi:hypothetical protein
VDITISHKGVRRVGLAGASCAGLSHVTLDPFAAYLSPHHSPLLLLYFSSFDTYPHGTGHSSRWWSCWSLSRSHSSRAWRQCPPPRQARVRLVRPFFRTTFNSHFQLHGWQFYQGHVRNKWRWHPDSARPRHCRLCKDFLRRHEAFSTCHKVFFLTER